MKKPLSLRKILAMLLTIAAVFAGQQAFATINSPMSLTGNSAFINGQYYYVWQISGFLGNHAQPRTQGQSYTFNGQNIGLQGGSVSITGTLNFTESNDFTDVTTGSQVTVEFYSTNFWFYGATVKKLNGTSVSGCSYSIGTNNNSITVTIPSGKTFGYIYLDYVGYEPFYNYNTTISGVEAEYIYTGRPIEPVPTVTYNGTVLTAGTDYTVSYSNSTGPGPASVTVTGTGQYAGTISRNYNIRAITLNDFTSLGNNTYAIATTADLDHLAGYVKLDHDCQGLTFKQTAVITYSHTTAWNSSNSGETNFTAIGGWGRPFKGTFDGQNHSISGIRISKSGHTDSDKCQGLFGYVGLGGTVRNVVLADTRIEGYTGTGGIAGVNDGTIEDCRVQDNVLVRSSGSYHTNNDGNDFGGIAGSNNGGTVTRCTSSATINGYLGHAPNYTLYYYSNNLGGVVGNNSGTVSNCLALNAAVTGDKYAAAIVGNNGGTLTANYYHNCTVTNDNHSNGSSIGVGVGTNDGSEDQDGARSVHTLTLPSDVTATGESVTVSGTTYYASNTTVTLAHGNVPAGYSPVYSVNGTAIEGDTFTMPAANVTVSVTLESIWSGSGTQGNPYVITTTDQLDALAISVKSGHNFSGTYFVLGNDIAYSTVGIGDTDENFITIGGYFDGSDKNFSGIFDGQNHTISGIRLYKNGTSAPSMNQGLFGRISGATIQNVILTDARITGYRYVGGLVGNKVSGTVQNCLVLESTITCADKYVGALFGKNTGTITANYYHNCTVNGTNNATNVGAGGNGGVSASGDMNGARCVHTLTLGEGITATPDPVLTYANNDYYLANTSITLGHNDPAEGYQVVYSLNGTPLTGNTFTMPANDVAVSATVTLITYTITYDLDGGEATNPTTYTVETETFTLAIPTKTGYGFTGWTGTDLTEPTQTVTITQGSTGDRSYTAHWIRIYTITYNLGGGSATNPITYTAETPTFTLENPILIGCVFEGWTGTDLTEPTQTVTITQGSTGDREYTAQWTDLWGVFNGADGSYDHPYTITTPEGLVYLSDFSRSNNTTYFYALGADIDMSSVDNFTPIGRIVSGLWYVAYYFDGFFDGQGHTISHLTINTTGTDVPGGLFAGNIDSFIWNIILDSANITAENYAGGIVGFREDDSYYLTNCLVLNSTITATASDGHAGAIIGRSWIPIYNSALSHNYYHNCTVNGTANATNVGIGSDVNLEVGYFSDPYDETADDGAMPVFSLTLGENITATPACAINFYNMITHNVFTYDGPLFYTAGTSITIEANEGYAITSATLTYGGNDYPIEPVDGVYSFTMPAEDATVSTELVTVMTWTDLKAALEAGGTRTVTLPNNVTRNVVEGINVQGTVTLDLNGYTIDGNSPDYYNSILRVNNGVSLTITDSGTGGNICKAGSNATVYVGEGGSLTLASGTINAQADGVYVYKGSFTMTGGTIAGSNFSGVFLNESATFTMTGGTITGNDEGVEFNYNPIESNGPTFTVSGNVNITGNTTKDVYLYYNGSSFIPIHIGGTLASTARIGINIDDYVASTITGDVVKVFTSGLSGYGTKQNFVLNGRDGHAIVTTADGELAIAQASIFTKDIAGYGNSDGSYYLIASPIGMVNPENVSNMTTNEYDLYRFNPSHEGNEWENYKAESFNLEHGKGYLYANTDNVTLTFSGPSYIGENCEIALVYDSTDYQKCWNLVGNPFDCNATLDREYYVLDENGLDINPEPIPATTPVPPCTAVFVKAVGVNDRAVFTKVTQ